MKGCLRVLLFFILFIFGLGALFYAYEKWQRVEKRVVVIMRSSNEDCDEYRCIWKIERVLKGQLDAEEVSSSCYLLNSKREYSKRDSTEWIEVEGVFTNENGQDFYADCIGTVKFWDKSVKKYR
ncbi:hypothetical protein [Hymenobacter weizhouensis]|uniref:hypothetical protein n=1 Tax=Hymenobacter sp. YIM 151500-1 TaxID=2987689 RepID=UPI0022277FE1|nr:hypothetical protein [Hymenobacter sp. YIM 151500-1]UYZ61438.1 hypothetical protein OIS53_10500 [Hymenobacter sp. YIM 151500-1]